MKRVRSCLLAISLVAFIALFTSSCQNLEHCDNEKWDPEHGENAIDCGGQCKPCPTLSAMVMGTPYNASTILPPNDEMGDTIFIHGIGAGIGDQRVEIGFQFIVSEANTTQSVTTGGLIVYYPFEGYEIDETDTGSVYISEINMQDRLISGQFSFTASNDVQVVSVNNGQFSNVAY